MKKLLSEEKYQKNNVKVKKVGKILLIVGGIVLVLGIVYAVAVYWILLQLVFW